jgi:hypothetical protein
MMTVYIIRGDVVTAPSSAPAKGAEGEVVIGSAREIAASALSLGQMVAVWNALPGTTAISKFKDRKTAAQRLWTAFARVPVDPEPTASGIRTVSRLEAGADDWPLFAATPSGSGFQLSLYGLFGILLAAREGSARPQSWGRPGQAGVEASGPRPARDGGPIRRAAAAHFQRSWRGLSYWDAVQAAAFGFLRDDLETELLF